MSLRVTPERIWHRVAEIQAPEGEFVETKIHDERGERNHQELRRQGRLWFMHDKMYVYYEPTHWRSRP